ncbi:MAG: class I SAM-dependent methyltransferase [Alphaproteobacteria bacterium]|nr:class I SAM-dependent methyltransferase [Alphaproteobacteria bacterium]
MLEKPDVISEEFIEYATLTGGTVLDIGTAYGATTISALKKGAYVIANDLDERHLAILQEKTPFELRERLFICKGKFPSAVDIQSSSLTAVLASGVLHYLEGKELKEAFLKVYDILKPGGKFFFFTSTPYIKFFEGFFDTYLKRKAEKAEWPGLIDNSWVYAPNHTNILPKLINLLDMDVTTQLFKESGFLIEKINYVSMEGYPLEFHSNGKEYIGVVAQKPL